MKRLFYETEQYLRELMSKFACFKKKGSFLMLWGTFRGHFKKNFSIPLNFLKKKKTKTLVLQNWLQITPNFCLVVFPQTVICLDITPEYPMHPTVSELRLGLRLGLGLGLA